MDKLPPPSGLQMTGNLAENWKRFKQRFELYLTAVNADSKPDKVKSSIFLHIIGEDALSIYNSFEFADGENMKLQAIMAKFEEYCIPRRNVTYERHIFLTRKQQNGESIDQYATELRNLVKTCEFGELSESLIKDRIILGIPDNGLRERLLREVDLTLDKALQMCRAAETIKKQSKELQFEVNTPVHAVTSKRGYGGAKPNKGNTVQKTRGKIDNKPECGRCGTKHERRKCPAYGKLCTRCGFRNHYSSMCRTKTPSRVHSVEEENSDPAFENFYVDTVQSSHTRKEWIVPLKIHNSIIPFKLDTGAQVNILPEKDYMSLQNRPKLNKSNVKITGYSGCDIPVKGVCMVSVSYKDIQHKLSFLVVPNNVQPILGISACDNLGLVKRVLAVELDKTSSCLDIVNEFQDLFEGLGCLPGEHKIHTDPDVKPVIHACRKVPFALHDKLKAELQRMESAGVIEKQEGPTDWVSSLVIVEKKDGSIRVCLDPRDLNKAVKREHFKLPTREEIMSKFANAKYFSKLDASSGFWQMKLDTESSKLCTFNTPMGRFRFLRLPFGISSAPEVYHRTVHSIYESVDGADTSMDDIIVWGTSLDEHNARLRETLEMTRKANLKLNKDKCVFGVNEVLFLGDVLSSDGVKPDTRKINAIVNMPQPESKSDVQRFLGMVNYLGKFIPDLSTITAPLRALLQKNTDWNWGPEHDKCWNKLKDVLTNEPVLKFYDQNRPIKISSDASQSGLGAVLLQLHDNNWLPVAYASRSMTDAEQRYAQIEKELLSITFAAERFHQFIYGQTFEVETDHKPLVPLFVKPLHDCPIRIQRLMIRLQKYDMRVSYTPGKFMYAADALSRAVVNERATSREIRREKEVEAFVDTILEAIPMSDERLEQVRQETATDDVMTALSETVLNGWPDKKCVCPEIIREYWDIRSELSVVNGLMMKGCKLVIPHSLRKLMISKIHEGHLGIEKCKQRAREVMYWPRMYQDISNCVTNCVTCLRYKPKQPAEPLQSHPVPERPFQKVGVDLFSHNAKDFLIVTDYYSSYPEVIHLKNTTSKAVIVSLKAIYARHGIPDMMFADNGPQFDSQEMRMFATTWGFQLQTSSPHYPKSNGLVERSVQTVKNILRKSIDSDSDFYLGLLVYRSTPLDIGQSPAQLLMGRRIRSNLPIHSDLLKTKDSKTVCRKKEKQQKKQKMYYDRKARELPPLKPGDKVVIRDYKTNQWSVQGTVRENVALRSYTVATEQGGLLRRNRVDIRPAPNESTATSSVSKGLHVPVCSEQTPRRSVRDRKTPSRLIECT